MTYADGKNPDLRVSDAERDVIVAELSQHFGDGRLDQSEFDQRLNSALAARTQRELGQLVADLPRPDPADDLVRSGQSFGRSRALAILPLLLAAVLITGALHGSWHHGGAGGWPFAPFGFVWLIIPVLVVRAWIRGGRRRQWR